MPDKQEGAERRDETLAHASGRIRGSLIFYSHVTQWARKDSNLEPSGYEPPALPLSYGPRRLLSHKG